MSYEPVDSPRQRVAALSADLREYANESGWEADDQGREGITVALLDAIDALLSELESED